MRATRPSLPILLSPGSSVTLGGLRVVLDEQAWPRAVILEGPVHGDRGRLAHYVPFEFAEPIPVPHSKQGAEWIQLAAARGDLRRARDTLFEGRARFGTDPPDFVVGGNAPLRVELAQFTDGRRRTALGLLAALRRAILEGAPSRFQHLRGRLVMTCFEDPRGLPPRQTDRGAIESLLDRLDKLSPGPDAAPLEVARDGHGYTVTVHNVPLGTGAMAAFPLPMMPDTKLAREREFELAACVTVTNRSCDIETELKRLARDHDAPQNDILLITAGAPGRSGLCLVADEIAVEEHVLGRIALPQPSQVKRILLHRWSFGDVRELYPSQRTLVDARVRDASGPCVVPMSKIPEEVWNGECPCGNGDTFAQCHGRLA